MTIKIDKTGHRYGKLLITGISRIVNGVVYWNVRCDCGTNKTVRDANIRRTKSCGCFESKRNWKHGFSDTRTYATWLEMKHRCLNKNSETYKDYGGRGIKICKRWLNSFETFLEDMGEKPEGLTIERIDNNGDYEPSNCKYANWEEQANNTRRNVSLTYQGITMNLSQWARKLGISRARLWARIDNNLPIDAIFSSKKFKACEARDIEYNLVS